jgi:hypothetical protein
MPIQRTSSGNYNASHGKVCAYKAQARIFVTIPLKKTTICKKLIPDKLDSEKHKSVLRTCRVEKYFYALTFEMVSGQCLK